MKSVFRLFAICLIFALTSACAIPGTVTKGLVGKQDISLWYSADSDTKTFTRSTSEGYSLTLNKLDWVGIDACQVWGGGVNRNRSVLVSAQSDISVSDTVDLWLSPGTWTIDDDLTFASYPTLYMHMAPGAVLEVANTKTLTLYSPHNIVPSSQTQVVFSGSGTVSYSKGLAWTSAPTGSYLLVAGAEFWADNDTWDPCTVDGTDDYKVRWNGSTWVCLDQIGGEQIVNISDTAFAASWDTATTVAPSQNAVYDHIHLMDTDDDGKVNNLDTGAVDSIDEIYILLLDGAGDCASGLICLGDHTHSGYLLIADIDDAPVDGVTAAPISSNWAYDHVAAADPHAGYVLESLYDAYSIIMATSDNTPVALTVTEQTVVGRTTGGAIAALAIDADLATVSENDDTVPSAKATKAALDAKESSTSNDFDPDRNACDSDDDDIIDPACVGDLSAIYEPVGLSVLLSTVTAAGDLIVGSGSGTVTNLAKGSNNSILAINGSGTIGWYTNITSVFPSVLDTDDTYSGVVTSYVAGEALAQWDVVYIKNKAGVAAAYKYDADLATYKTYPPRAIATAAIDADASGVFLIQGFVRNDAWDTTSPNFVTNQDEGKAVYATTTAGLLDIVAPAVTGDMVFVLGYLVEQNIIQFVFSPIGVEVP